MRAVAAKPRVLSQEKLNCLLFVRRDVNFEKVSSEVNYVSIIIKDKQMSVHPIFIACIYLNPQAS